jgi:hypothetical protein
LHRHFEVFQSKLIWEIGIGIELGRIHRVARHWHIVELPDRSYNKNWLGVQSALPYAALSIAASLLWSQPNIRHHREPGFWAIRYSD